MRTREEIDELKGHEWITVQEAALWLVVKPQRVFQLLEKKQLTAETIHDRKMILMSVLRTFQENRRKRGRPRKDPPNPGPVVIAPKRPGPRGKRPAARGG